MSSTTTTMIRIVIQLTASPPPSVDAGEPYPELPGLNRADVRNFRAAAD
jgi:hypothetical protein